MLTPQFKDYSKFVDDDKKIGYVNITDHSYTRTLPCFETSRRLSVNSDGNVWCGHNLSESFGQFLGNIKDQSLYDIWNGKTMTEFRNKVRTGVFERLQCKECGEELRTSERKA
jgi:radical SAM protein with 4Fe4S-binding SPASM domain